MIAQYADREFVNFFYGGLRFILERIPVMWKRSLHVGSNWRILAY